VSGYLGGELSVLCIAIIYAYGVFVPVATGQLNLGGAGFQATGAYTAALLNTQLGYPAWVTVPVGTLVGALVATLIAVPVLRTRGAYMVLATMAFSELVGGLALVTPGLGGATGLPVPDYVGLNVLAPITVAVVALGFLLMATRAGLAMRAVHDDEAGGALVGLSGALYAHQFGFVNAGAFDVIQSVDVLLCVLLGGTQTAWGPLVGTIVFTLLPEVLRNLLPWLTASLQSVQSTLGVHSGKPDDAWRFVILGVCTVAMMALRPEGLVTRRMVDRLHFSARRALAPA
jgi:branched-chain amino acid transport system permease protein